MMQGGVATVHSFALLACFAKLGSARLCSAMLGWACFVEFQSVPTDPATWRDQAFVLKPTPIFFKVTNKITHSEADEARAKALRPCPHVWRVNHSSLQAYSPVIRVYALQIGIAFFSPNFSQA